MKKILMIILGCTMFITGCNNNSAYNDYMEKGKSSIVEEEYEKSKEYFSLAMEEKKDDKESKALYEQTNYLTEAIRLKHEGNTEDAITSCEKIIGLKSESDVIKKVSEKLKKEYEEELNKLDEKIKEIEEKIKDAEDMIKAKKYSKAKISLGEILEKFEQYEGLSDKVLEIKELIKKCDKKIKEIDTKKSQINNSKSKSNNGNKVYCSSCGKYVNKKNYESEMFNKCNGCIISRDLSSSMMNSDCENCGGYECVTRMNGICNSCNVKVAPAVSDILEDGTVIFEDGTRL